MLERAKYKILLGIMFGFLLIKPLADGMARGVLAEILVGIVFIAMLNALRDRRRAFFIAAWLIFGIVLARGGHHATGSVTLRASSYVLCFFVVCVAGIEVLRGVLQARKVTPEVVTGALCVYLLIGTAWTFIYLVMLHFDPSAIHLPVAFKAAANISLATAQTELTAVLYYSMGTMTTLSFGDATPSSAIARNLAVCECISGQLYLTVLVARLVGFSTSTMLDDG